MPDLLSHAVIAHLGVRRWQPKPWALLFIIGTLLPDILTRPINILLPSLRHAFVPLHTPVGIAIAYWGIAALFVKQDRRVVFWALLGGALLHYLLDAPQAHVSLETGYFWLFPFSWASYTDGWYEAHASLRALPALLGLTALIEGVFFLRRRRSS